MVRKHYRFTGRVQGVGFRYRAKHAASGMCVTGWVRNEGDGSVEMEVQGTEEAINRMLVMINRSNYIQIDTIECREIPPKEQERTFQVR
ncbi:acylphosphatase [Lachnospiraceae bacterium]|jgi:acylphosphatase|nr:acylphosphatase [Lachnospiraceae bacterium]MCX4272753.1 acylphosphatase [Acetatifactor sp.]GFH96613.1 acylphosphatase [Lachnospiraceae bacterium]